MTDGPQLCALPGCDEIVEQPEDGGPRRLYCSPAHRAAARKMRHAARMDAAAPPTAAADVTQPIAQAPKDPQSEQPTTELPAPLGTPRQEEPEPAPVPDREWSPAAAWTVSPPTLPSPRTVRTITSQRVKKQKPARTAGDRKNAVTHMRRRAIASVAIASLVAGGASYFVSENVIPTTPTPLPPQAANQPSMDADVWVDKAEVVLASLSSQLDAVAHAEATWLALPADRRAQEPAAVQALKERKALLEQQRATLMSQLEAFKALPERTSELTSAQAQLDAVERTLNESTTTAASPDYQEALRQLESQREMRRQQRDHAAQALTDLRNGVEQALSAPLPAEKDETTPIVERVKAVAEGRPDPAEKDDDQEHRAADDRDPAATQRRDDGDEERGDVGTTAPPDPERPNTPDILAAGDGNSDSGGGSGPDGGSRSDAASEEANGGDKRESPVQSVAGALGSALGQGDTTNRDERANKRESRTDDSSDDAGNNRDDERAGKDDRGDDDRGLGDVVRGVTGGLLGGGRSADKDDDKDDRSESRGRDDDRSDDRDGERGDDRDDDRGDRSGWFSDRGDRDDDSDDDDRSNRRERDDDDDDDRGGIRGIADGLLGGNDRDDDEHADDDGDRKKPSGKAERKREKDREEREDKGDRGEHADDDGDRKKPSGKAERKREKDREERGDKGDKKDRGDKKKDRGDKDDDDKKDRGDKKKDRGDKDDDDKDDRGDKKKDRGDKDDDDKDDSDKGDSDDGDDDGGKSDKGSDKSDGDSGGDDD
jgi:hypothetical protein